MKSFKIHHRPRPHRHRLRRRTQHPDRCRKSRRLETALGRKNLRRLAQCRFRKVSRPGLDHGERHPERRRQVRRGIPRRRRHHHPQALLGFRARTGFQDHAGSEQRHQVFRPDRHFAAIDRKTGKPTTLGSSIGLEFQILDDAGHPDAKAGKDGNRTVGSLYDLIPAPKDKQVAPPGEWNQARILSKGNHVTFWLNGREDHLPSSVVPRNSAPVSPRANTRTSPHSASGRTAPSCFRTTATTCPSETSKSANFEKKKSQ